MAPKGSLFLTGANGGLGSAIVAKVLDTPHLAGAYHGIYSVRNVETASTLQRLLSRAPQVAHNADVLSLDLSRLASVRAAAAEINRRVAAREVPPIRALVLNAGWQEFTTQSFSEDGFDMSFQCNYLGHWLLALLVLQSMDRAEGRIVIVGSCTHDPADKLNEMAGKAYADPKWRTLFHDTDSLAKGTWSPRLADESPDAGFRRYAAAKLCEIMMMYELQKRLDSDPELSNISILGVDPGAMATSLGRRNSWFTRTILVGVVLLWVAWVLTWWNPTSALRTTWQSAGDIVRACFDTSEVGERPKAKYYNGTVEKKTSPESKDPKKWEMLWKDSVCYAGLKEGDTALSDWR